MYDVCGKRVPCKLQFSNKPGLRDGTFYFGRGGWAITKKKFLHSKSREKKIMQSSLTHSQAKCEKKLFHKLKTEKKILAQKNCPTPLPK